MAKKARKSEHRQQASREPVLGPGCIGASIMRGNRIAVQFSQSFADEQITRMSIEAEMLAMVGGERLKAQLRDAIKVLFFKGSYSGHFPMSSLPGLKEVVDEWKDIVDIVVGPTTPMLGVEVTFVACR